MLSVVRSATVIGLEALAVTVEVDISFGLPAFNIVGLPDVAIRESRERVRSGIENSEYEFPLRRITVNLAPGDVRKEGPSFDLPIALAVLAATGVAAGDGFTRYLIAGELSLTGEVKQVSGALSIAVRAEELGYGGVMIPTENAAEASLVKGIEVLPVSHLREAVDFFNGTSKITPVRYDGRSFEAGGENYDVDFAEVKGQEHVKRALEVAAAGGHNMLMIGPPGAGKTMLARRLPTIMPSLPFEEAVEITRIYSVGGLIASGESLVMRRPFRSPHHTVSSAGLVGGGRTPRPGEVSLGHRGILFLDELPEFSKSALEVLRQPMEDGVVTISRAAATLTYPADFMLVASMNPCPCGYLGDRVRECVCTPTRVRLYRTRISGPLVDRIDIQVEVARLSKGELMSTGTSEPSAVVRERVERARALQVRRFDRSRTVSNASMRPAEVKKYVKLDGSATLLLERAIDRLALSGRAFERVLKMARTIADLAGVDGISVEHVAEAIQYRALDREVSG